ncbi:MAG: hypothetical protein N2645_12835 [Clostridia bacterium]|nr:hypothetical protein [Clostridia bacterium]
MSSDGVKVSVTLESAGTVTVVADSPLNAKRLKFPSKRIFQPFSIPDNPKPAEKSPEI